MAETVVQTDHEHGAAPAPPPRGRRGRRTVLVASALVVVAAVAVVGALGLGGGGSQEGSSAPPRSGSTVPVTRTTLTERTTVDGQLGYGTEIPLPVKATGTVTWLPAEGTTVKRRLRACCASRSRTLTPPGGCPRPRPRPVPKASPAEGWSCGRPRRALGVGVPPPGGQDRVGGAVSRRSNSQPTSVSR
ncbi:hypothetical protein GCM10023097_60820 [Streptomyces collinus]